MEQLVDLSTRTTQDRPVYTISKDSLLGIITEMGETIERLESELEKKRQRFVPPKCPRCNRDMLADDVQYWVDGFHGDEIHFDLSWVCPRSHG